MIVQIGPFCESGEEPRVLAVGRYVLEIAFERPITKTLRYVGDFD